MMCEKLILTVRDFNSTQTLKQIACISTPRTGDRVCIDSDIYEVKEVAWKIQQEGLICYEVDVYVTLLVC
ncbi:MAG: hypothetical protein Q7R33_10220 [Nitrosarchaeum sp.]|nr:hypothetical protein [Nitrosarchaeum sp.]